MVDVLAQVLLNVLLINGIKRPILHELGKVDFFFAEDIFSITKIYDNFVENTYHSWRYEPEIVG